MKCGARRHCARVDKQYLLTSTNANPAGTPSDVLMKYVLDRLPGNGMTLTSGLWREGLPDVAVWARSRGGSGSLRASSRALTRTADYSVGSASKCTARRRCGPIAPNRWPMFSRLNEVSA